MHFFQVRTKLQHNGEEYPVGRIFSGEQGEFSQLVADGVLRVIEGANTAAEAAAMADIMDKKAAADAEAGQEVQPKNTWEAQPDRKPDEPAAAPSDEAKTEEIKTPEGANDQKPAEVGAGDLPPTADAGDNL